MVKVSRRCAGGSGAKDMTVDLHVNTRSSLRVAAIVGGFPAATLLGVMLAPSSSCCHRTMIGSWARHTLPQQALQTPLLQLKDAEESQQTWMPFEQERAARDCVVKRRTIRQLMLRIRVLRRILVCKGRDLK